MARLSAFLFVLSMFVWETNAACGACSSTVHYRCTTYNQYQFCDTANAPVGSLYTCPANSWCSTTGTNICTTAAPECTCGICTTAPSATTTTIACVSDTQYATCNAGGDIIPDSAPTSCLTGQFCSASGTSTTPCVANTTPNPSGCVLGSGTANVCPATGRYAVANTACKNYILCTTLANGTMTYYTYACPSTSLFDPAAQTCSITYICPP